MVVLLFLQFVNRWMLLLEKEANVAHLHAVLNIAAIIVYIACLIKSHRNYRREINSDVWIDRQVYIRDLVVSSVVGLVMAVTSYGILFIVAILAITTFTSYIRYTGFQSLEKLKQLRQSLILLEYLRDNLEEMSPAELDFTLNRLQEFGVDTSGFGLQPPSSFDELE